jgi:hypothetical protein
VLERHRDLLKRGTVLVDERDHGTSPRVLMVLEHAVQDASLLPSGEHRTISRRLLYVEMDAEGQARHLQYAPYLDYRPLADDEPSPDDLLARPECAWIGAHIEAVARNHAIATVVPEHVREVRDRRIELVEKTRAAVHDRLTKEIAYWDYRAEQLALDEQAGKPAARMNSVEARRRADDLRLRLRRRIEELDREARVSALPPVVLGGLVVVPIGLLAAMTGRPYPLPAPAVDTGAAAALGRRLVMEVERKLGYDPIDRESDKLGYDIESRVVSGSAAASDSSRSRPASPAPIRSPSPATKSSPASTSPTTTSSPSSNSTPTAAIAYATCAAPSGASPTSASPA